MEKEKNKKLITIVIILLILMILGVSGYFLYDRLLLNNEDTNENNIINEPKEETITNENKGEALKNINYKIVNEKRLGLSDKDQWTLVEKIGYDEYNEAYKITPSDNLLGTIDDNLASQMKGYEYGFIDGYYNNDTFYTSIISDKKLIIKKINFKNENKSYDEYINISMPASYELCGLWEGTRKNNDCSATILYMNENNIYFHTVGEEYTEDIYLLNINERTITKVNSSYRLGPHSMPKAYNYNDNLILNEDAGLFIIDTTVGNNFQTIFNIEQYTSGQLSLPSIKDGELYFSLEKIEVSEPTEGRTEIHIDYKYNFETKKVTELNKTSNYIPY